MKFKRNYTKKKHNISKIRGAGTKPTIKQKGIKATPPHHLGKKNSKTKKTVDIATEKRSNNFANKRGVTPISTNIDLYTNNQSPYFKYVKNFSQDMTPFTASIKSLNAYLYNGFTPIKNVIDVAHPIKSIYQTFIGDTFHDLCQDRGEASSTNFKNKILPRILNEATATYDAVLPALFEGTVKSSVLEPDINAYIENTLLLRPAYVEISTDNIIDLYKNPNPSIPDGFAISNESIPVKSIKDIIVKSNGTLKIKFPNDMTVNDYMASKWGTHEILYICDFIKRYLHDNGALMEKLEDKQRPLSIEDPNTEIRFLFDAGMVHIGKLFKTPRSNGIRVIGMACTADSASSSSESLIGPNEYIRHESGYEINTNLFSSNDIEMSLHENKDCHFGRDGIHCFSVNFKRIHGDPVHNSCKYVFGPKPDSYYTPGALINEDEPCGYQGGSVPHLQTIFEKYIDPNNRTLTAGAADIDTELRSNGKFSHIPVGDPRILKLLDPDPAKQITEMDILFRLLADYKRTGDYEQALTLLHEIIRVGSNASNYTFSTGDLLSALFARLNGLPTVYQVSSAKSCVFNNYLTLFSSDYWNASDEDRRKEQEKRNFMHQQAINELSKQNLIDITEKFFLTYQYFDTPLTFSPGIINDEITQTIIDNILTDVIEFKTEFGPMFTNINTTDDIKISIDRMEINTVGPMLKKFNDYYEQKITKYPNFFSNIETGNKFSRHTNNPNIKDARVNLHISKGVENRVKILKGLHETFKYNEQRVRYPQMRSNRNSIMYMKQYEESEQKYKASIHKLASSLSNTDDQLEPLKTNIKTILDQPVPQTSQSAGGIGNTGMVSGGNGQQQISLQYSIKNIIDTISTKCFDYLKGILKNIQLTTQDHSKLFIFGEMPTNYSNSNSLLLVNLSEYLLENVREIQELIDDFPDLSIVSTLYDLLYLLNIREIFTGNSRIPVNLQNENQEYLKTYVLKIVEKYWELLNSGTGINRKTRSDATFHNNFLTILKYKGYDISEVLKPETTTDQAMRNNYLVLYDDFLDGIDAVIINVISLFSMVNKTITDTNTYPIYLHLIINPTHNLIIDPTLSTDLLQHTFDRYTLNGTSLVWPLFERLTGIDIRINNPTRTTPQGQGHGGNKTRKKRKNKKQGGTKRVRR